MRKPGDVTYTANICQEGRNIEVTVIRDVYAGVSGPEVTFIVQTTDLDEVDAELTRNGFTRTGGWQFQTSYQGMHLTAPVEH